MKIKVFGFDFILEFSFLLILCFGIILGARDLVMLLLFSCLHELGHVFALLSVGGKIDTLTLSFYGLALKYNSGLCDIKELFVILCGPLVNLILYLFLKDDINLILFCLNIVPVYPLDGGRIARIVFPKASIYISAVTLVLLCVLSLYMIVFYKSFSLILISCYLVAYSINY